jgi:DNA-binding protein HU-beta
MKMAVKPAPMPKKVEKNGAEKKTVVGLTALVEKVARKTRYSKRDVAEVIRTLNEAVAAEIQKGNTVRLPGLGTFTRVEKAARSVNAFGKGVIEVPARRVVRFRPATAIKNM